MGPILPMQAEVPSTWLQGVKAVGDREGGLKSGWVDSLIKQMHAREEKMTQAADELGSPSRHTSLLRGQRAGSDGLSASISGKEETKEGLIKLHPPHLTINGGPAPGLHRPLLRQGPVLLDPAPEEAGADMEEEDRATDLLVLEAGDEGELVIGVCWAGGRVDLGMMVDTSDPRWISTKVCQTRSQRHGH